MAQAHQDPALTPEPDEAEKPVGQFVTDVTSELSTLLRKELELAKVELAGEMRQAAKAGGMLGGGALSGYFALLLGSLGLAELLAAKLPRWLAFFLVAGLYGTAAGTLLNRGRQEIQQVDPVPQQTVESLKENVELVKNLGV